MPSKPYATTKTNLKQGLLLIFLGLSIIYLVIYGITFYLKRRHEEMKQLILSNPVESKGIVVSFTSYKGKGATIQYLVNGHRFEIKPSISNEFFDNNFVGDSVAIVYFKVKPEKAILKYQLGVPIH